MGNTAHLAVMATTLVRDTRQMRDFMQMPTLFLSPLRDSRVAKELQSLGLTMHQNFQKEKSFENNFMNQKH